jgi:hypothetical protein
MLSYRNPEKKEFLFDPSENPTVADILSRLQTQEPEMFKNPGGLSILVNNKREDPLTPVAEGDVLTLIELIVGG